MPSISSEAPDLPTTQRQLILRVYTHFRATGLWPSAIAIRIALRDEGGLETLCAALGPRIIVCGNTGAPTDKCELRIYALPLIDEGRDDLNNAIGVLRWLAESFITSEGEKRHFTMEELAAPLSLDQRSLARAAEFLKHVPDLYASYTHTADGLIGEFVLSPDVMDFEKVRDLDDVLLRITDRESRRRTKLADLDSSNRVRADGKSTLRALARHVGGQVPLGLSARPAFDIQDLHPQVVSAAHRFLSAGHHNEAVRQALLAFEARIRTMAAESGGYGNLDLSGDALITRAFSASQPLIKLKPGSTKSEQNEQRGFFLIAQGVMAWMRNTLSHEPLPEMTWVDAIERLALVSLLLRRLDASELGLNPSK